MKTDRTYQICSHCILSTEDDPDIFFDEKGVCNHCNLYDSEARKRILPEEEGKRRLAELVKNIKEAGKGKKYDCVIGVSGGADSTYVAYIVKEVLGLRPLAVHCDNGWDSELAVSNIAGLLKKLDIDLVTYVIDWNEFKDLQLAYLKASVIDVEATSDHAIFATLYKFAHQYGIKHILSGENFLTEGILPAAWVHNKNDLVNIRAIYRRFGTNGKLKTFPTLGYRKKFFFEKIEGIKYVRILDYVPYLKDDARRLIEQKFGWRDYGGKHYESIITRFYQSYILPVKFGVDKRRSHLSTLICSNQLSREKALEEVAHPPYDAKKLEDDKEYVIKKFGLSHDEFNRIMAQPVRLHTNYLSIVTLIKNIKAIVGLFSKPKKINGRYKAKGNRVAMLLDNTFENDLRVFLEAKTIAEHFDLTVYAVQGKGLPVKAIENGIKVHRIFPDNIFKIQNLDIVEEATRRIAIEKYDLVHCHDHLMLWAGSQIKKRNPETVLIYDSHELFHSWPLNYSSTSFSIMVKSFIVRKYQIYLEKKVGRYIDYLITVNYSLADILSKYFRLKTSPVVTRNLPPFEKAVKGQHLLRKQMNIPANDKILVFIGKYVYPKTLNMEAVIDQVGNKEGITFVFICTANINRKAIENYALAKKYKNILFHDVISPSEITSYLTDCDAGIVSTWNKKDLSYWYALDNKLFNYLMAEIPIVATAQPEYKIIIEKHGLGICVNPDKPNAYYEGLKWVIENNVSLKENLAIAKVELNWENEKEKLTALYDQLLQRFTGNRQEQNEKFLQTKVAMLLDNPFVTDKRVYREATALINEGYSVNVFAVKDDSLPNEEMTDGILTKRFFDKSIFDIKQIRNLYKVARELGREKFDILHCHDWRMLYIGFLIKKINPWVILVYDSHEIFYSWPINYSSGVNRWIRLKSFVVRQLEIYLEKKSSPLIDHLIAVSPSAGKVLKNHLGFRNTPVVVKNIVEHEEVVSHSDILRKEFNLPSSTKIIVSFSLYIYRKSRNLEAAIEQFANVKDIALVVICKDGGNRQEIMNLVKNRNIKNIFFHDPVYGKEIINVLSSADMGIVTTWNKKYLSYWLGLETKIFHYIMAELPVLATAQPEHLNVIDKYKVGVCINADKPDAYLQGYHDIVNHYDEYKKNAISAKKFLHWDNEKVQLIELYQTIEKEMNGNR